jgi:hypothetical protein
VNSNSEECDKNDGAENLLGHFSQHELLSVGIFFRFYLSKNAIFYLVQNGIFIPLILLTKPTQAAKWEKCYN